ncbi:MAG TPA: family 20 glycosylhydrolase, partial [Longimicrobiales bacterium]|nr:family 20 glycosylhydrolase [Longimicrobiales bacterium]
MTARALAVAVVLLFLGACGPSVRELAMRYPLVPRPAELEARTGAFVVDRDTRILLSAPDDSALVRMARRNLAEPIRLAAGLPLPLSDRPARGPVANVIVLRLDGPAGTDGAGGAEPAVPPSVTGDIPAGRGATAEAYTLSVTEDRIELAAATRTGLFRGLQALRELLPPTVDGAIRALSPWGRDAAAGEAPPDTSAADRGPISRIAAGRPAGGSLPVRVPAVEIRDAPRFPWRGMHLDVGRHFFPVEFIEKYIDLLALHRMNTFHWHLTEDQGWRIEIQRYPRLTLVGGCRAETMVEKNFEPFVGDSARYCGYYAQDEVRRVVAYAAERHITVVPEIEMPGHSSAALAAYPELACTPGPFEVATGWGVFPDIYCPTEETFAFLENVLTEVMALFPSRYIHIGGDEAPKEAWRASSEAQAIMRREGLA